MRAVSSLTTRPASSHKAQSSPETGFLQLVTACSHNPQGVSAVATLLARKVKLFNVPTFLTTGLAERQELLREVAAVFPDQTPVDRTTLNSFEDPRVVEWGRSAAQRDCRVATAMEQCTFSLRSYDVPFLVPRAAGLFWRPRARSVSLFLTHSLQKHAAYHDARSQRGNLSGMNERVCKMMAAELPDCLLNIWRQAKLWV